ncbi:hypothetical protein ACFXCZ_12670 [Streptomyces sp. NPDC059396]|uniref:hypothetical protein n=1 Tax=Streptomyces sp. NPDC059396 TaxID=3346819 RepID=UPI0036ACF6E7
MRARHRACGGRSTARSPRKPPPAPTWRPDPGRRQPTLFERIPREYSRLALTGADLAGPWPAGAKYLAHRLSEARGRGRDIRFAANRSLASVESG